MDEIVDGSLDEAGIDDFMKLLQELPSNINVFVISPKADSFIDKFDRVIEFEKMKNFSKMKEDDGNG